jgi:hypothetical protein
MAKTKAGTESAYRLWCRQRLEDLQPKIDALAEEPALAATAAATALAEQEYRSGPDRPRHTNVPDTRAIELNRIANESRAAHALVRDGGRAAAQEANELRALLRAAEDAFAFRTELDALAADGRDQESQRATMVGQRAKLQDEANRIEERIRAEREANAERRLLGQLDEAATGSASADSDAVRLRELRDLIPAADRIVVRCDARIAELAARAAEVSSRLRVAQRMAATLTYLEWDSDVAPLRVELLAAGGALPTPRVDQVAIRRRAEELRIESEPWRPGDGVASTAHEDTAALPDAEAA